MLDIRKLLAKVFGPTHPPRRTLRSRLRCEPLEDKLAPAAFSFVLPNGDIGSGLFTAPADQVDPGQASQSITIDDLEFTLGGVTFSGADFSAAPTAEYAGGVLQGVSFDLASTPTDFPYADVWSAGGTVTAAEAYAWLATAPVTSTYDPAAETGTFSFTLADGRAGSGTFSLAGGHVSPGGPTTTCR